MARRKTDAEFRAEVRVIAGDEYTFLESYKGANSKILVKHNICGQIYAITPNSFLRGTRCAKCYVHNKATTDTAFRTKIKSLVGSEYQILDKYKGARVKITFKHAKCGFEFKMSPSNFLGGHRCPKCMRKKAHLSQAKTDMKFKQEVQRIVGNQYLVLGKYKTCSQKIKFKHKKCGFEFKMSPSNFLRGCRCPKCMRMIGTSKRQKSPQSFKIEFYKVAGNDYILVNSYKNYRQKIIVLHSKCGCLYSVAPFAFLSGRRCPYCFKRTSRGEQLIEKYLSRKKIDFRGQYYFLNCKDQKVLPFDFAVFNKDKTLNCLIEYQGEQHFYNPFTLKSKRGVFSAQSILNTQKHDAMKLQYCKDHGIKLIRINHPQTSSESNSIEFIERLVNRTLNKELHVV